MKDRPRFGAMAVALGFVHPQDVERALRQQDAERRRGQEPGRVGDLLVGLGLLTREQQSVVMRSLPRRAAPPRPTRPAPRITRGTAAVQEALGWSGAPRRPAPSPGRERQRIQLAARYEQEMAVLRAEVVTLQTERERWTAELDRLTEEMIQKEDLIASLQDLLRDLQRAGLAPQELQDAA